MVEFRLLGRFEVVEGDRPVALGGPKQRALLAVLLLRRGEAVSSDRLIDEIWGEQPPASANKIVQGYVSHLRKALGDGLLVTQGRGYLLRTEPGQTDADRFEALAGQGREALERGDALTAAAVLREALGVWRGPALADFAYAPFAQAEIARLEESRVAALEDRIDADLALGEQTRLVGELEGLVREHPLREHLRGQLMLALYRSGRQADALQAYQDARRELLDGLGLEPGGALQELERAILTHDPGVDLPAGHAPQPPPAAARSQVRGAALIAAAGAVLLAAIAAVAVKLASSGASSVRVAPNEVAAIDTRSDRVVGAVPVGDRPGGIAFGSGSLWVANLGDQTISRVDPNGRRTLPMIPVGGQPAGIAAGSHGVWVVESPGTSSVLVGRVDPVFNTFGNVAKIGNVDPTGAVAIATQANSVWVAPSTGLLTRLNGTTGKFAARVDPNASPAGIAIGEGATWLTDTDANNVVRVDSSGLTTPIGVGDAPTGIAVGGGGVWVVDSLDEALVRIDPDSRAVTDTIRVGRSPAGVAVGAGSVWVANSGDGTVTRVNPTTDKPVTIAVGGSPQAITIADGKAWVTVDAQSIAPSRGAPDGGTLRLVSASDVPFMDPALDGDPQLLYATCAQLLNYPDKAGLAGSQLTPEVAQSLPARSPDRRTYTFKIRPGFRFSPRSNEPVTAQTFKDTLERTLNPGTHSYYAHFLADIVGAGAYMSGKASHIAGVIAHGDTLTVRLLAPAPDFLARISQPAASCAIPSDTPVNRKGQNMIPSAGPYYVSSYTPHQGVVLMRNPNYHGRRPHHFARIELAVRISPKRAISEIEAGLADYTTVGVGWSASAARAAHASRLAARYGAGSAAAAHGAQQYFANPADQLDYFVLNTHRPLFSDVRMRQAVNYAINRRALAQRGDRFSPLPAQPAHSTDHYLPPGMPGFRDDHVYPMTPDVVKARRLARGGNRTAVLYTCDSSPCPEQAQIVKTDLAAIGLQVQIKKIPYGTYFTTLGKPGHPFDLAWDGWLPDYIDPAAMLNSLLADSSSGPTFDDPAYRRRMAAASRLSGPERYLTYGRLDLTLARDAAPLAAFDNLYDDDFFSARIGCQTYGIYGMDLAALCIRRPHHR